MTINFDMDGTIADLYGVDGWLDMLTAEDTTPYAIAKPLVNLRVFARYVNKLTKAGHTINIISWTSKKGSEEYNEAVAEVKKEWLKIHLKSVTFSAIHIVPYGTPKEDIATGVLFDDEEKNRNSWKGIAFNEKEMMEQLKYFANMYC